MTWDQLTTIQKVDVWLVHLMLVGQTVFIIIWGLLPWWKEWIGRALMVKSFALWLLILIGVVNLWMMLLYGPWPLGEYLAYGTHVLVVIGIWSQVFALMYEKRRARRDDNEVVGTETVLPPTHSKA